MVLVGYGALMNPATPPLLRRRPGRPRGGTPVANRDTLVAAAVSTARRHGADTTMDDIAATAAVGKPVLYRYLGDRAEVVDALSEWLTEQVKAATLGNINPADPPRTALHSAVAGFVDTVVAQRGVFLFVNAGGHDVAVFDRLIRGAATPLAEVFSDTHTAASALTRSLAVVGVLQITVTAWLIEPHCSADQLVDDLVDLLWSGIGTTIT